MSRWPDLCGDKWASASEALDVPDVQGTLSFFETLGSELEHQLLEHLQAEEWPAGEVVIKQGTVGETLYIVRSGTLQVTHELETGVQHVLGEMGPGEIFGEMALLEERPRSAGVVALTPVSLLTISLQTFERLIDQHPRVVVHLLKMIGARLRERNQQQEALLAEKGVLVEALEAKNAELERTFEQLQTAMETVAEHERVTRDLEMARQIQRQMLPSEFPQVKGLELDATTVPSQWVSGDFYDAVRLDDDRVCLLLGDVSGKGIPAAMQMARLMGEFRACVSHQSDPVSVVRVLNESVCARNREWTSFVTVQYVVLDLKTRLMQYLCAGHPPLLLYHANGGLDWLGKVTNLPLGLEVAFTYQQEESEVASGDRLLMYSDGAYEARNAGGHMLGLSQLSILFTQTPPHPSAAIQALLDNLHAYAPAEHLHDDTTFVCARVI